MFWPTEFTFPKGIDVVAQWFQMLKTRQKISSLSDFTSSSMQVSSNLHYFRFRCLRFTFKNLSNRCRHKYDILNLIFGGILKLDPTVRRRCTCSTHVLSARKRGAAAALLLEDSPVQRRGTDVAAAVFATTPATFISISPQKLFCRMLLNILSHHQLIV
jgi:hypothetical protein